jgi:hypothetical protein
VGSIRALCLVAGVALAAACGPIEYLHRVSFSATRALAEAKTAGAEKLAPYEYWSAVEYLQMAKEMAAYADYQVAHRYGELAEKTATDARRLAAEKSQAGPAALGGDGSPKGADESPPDLGKTPAKESKP